MEIREDPAVTRTASPPCDPEARTGGTKDGNIGSGEAGSSVLSKQHVEVIDKLTSLFEKRKDDLDLAIMKVIAEGGSPSEWLVGMLRASIPQELREASPPKPRFLGE